METVITTKEELKKAKKQKMERFVVRGKLASDIKKARAITKLSASSILILTTVAGMATIAAPTTGGASYLAAAPAVAAEAASVGVSVPAIVVAVSIGVSLIIGLFRDYNVKFKMDGFNHIEAEFNKK